MRFSARRSTLAPDPDLIRSLAKLLDETGLTEIEYAVGDQRIRVSPADGRSGVRRRGIGTPSSAEKALAATAPPPGSNGAARPGANGHDHPGVLKAPLVGIAYIAAEPGQPPYVKIGDTIAEGQTLLIIEAMKVMNQIRAPRSGRCRKSSSATPSRSNTAAR